MKRKIALISAVILCVVALCVTLLLCSCGENEAKNPTDTTEKPVTNTVTDPATEPETEPETEPVHEHNFGEWTAEIPVTCTENGTKGYYFCASCGKYFDAEHNEIVDVAIAALGHAEVVEEETLATCTNEGKISYKCTVCGYSRTEILQILPHQFERTLVPPTCVSAGKTVDACSVCGKQNETIWSDINCDCSIRYSGHELIRNVDIYSVAVSGVVGNCFDEVESDDEEVGYITISNTIPNYHYEGLLYSGTLYKNDRGYSGTVYLPRGYNNVLKINILVKYGGGLIIYLQTNGERTDEKIAVDHTLSDWIIDKEATHKTTGQKHQVCEVCGEILNVEEIPRIASEGLAYEINTDDNTCTITGVGSCTDTEILIPDVIDGYVVTAIGKNAFSNCNSITAIELSNNIEAIGQRAFYRCEGLTQFTIPSSVGDIGTQIFLGCSSLEKVYYNSYFSPGEGLTFLNVDSIKEVVFGDNITSLPSYICYGCGFLEKVTLPSHLISIGSYCFYQCASLKSIEFPDTIIELGEYSFYESGLKSIVIPNSVTSITHTFRGCRFEYVVIPNTVVAVNGQSFYCCSIDKVYYEGDELDWSGINIDDYSKALEYATRYYYSESKPDTEGLFWHYVDGMIEEW